MQTRYSRWILFLWHSPDGFFLSWQSRFMCRFRVFLVSVNRLNDENYFIRFYTFIAFPDFNSTWSFCCVYVLCVSLWAVSAIFVPNHFIHGKQNKTEIEKHNVYNSACFSLSLSRAPVLLYALSIIYFDTTPEEFWLELFTEWEILFGICQFLHAKAQIMLTLALWRVYINDRIILKICCSEMKQNETITARKIQKQIQRKWQ